MNRKTFLCTEDHTFPSLSNRHTQGKSPPTPRHRSRTRAFSRGFTRKSKIGRIGGFIIHVKRNFGTVPNAEYLWR